MQNGTVFNVNWLYIIDVRSNDIGPNSLRPNNDIMWYTMVYTFNYTLLQCYTIEGRYHFSLATLATVSEFSLSLSLTSFEIFANVAN